MPTEPFSRLELGLGAALAAGLAVWTALGWGGLTFALVVASLLLAGGSLWSCGVLYGAPAARRFLACGVTLGWLAEEAGATLGWLFGSYAYTAVLGPKLGAVPVVIPLMWFGLCHLGWVLACLLLWRTPVAPRWGWPAGALTAALAALLVTAFDLGADPYFVYVLKAWIMTKTDGGWFGETIRGFEGWLIVSFTIVCLFQLWARPTLAAGPVGRLHRAALLPVGVYAGFILFQVTQAQPVALRVVAFFAMGIPALVAAVAWHLWTRTPGETA